ncbi:AI-2E family transporter [Plantactinospora sp. KBS50]|uniref:AI-2E family transporter n=1 Tax=Plantactinospora sp. KBS50 TaxID=2024580 RepID=UPI0012FD214B|nr:AI-2E family transporter [Plantactinospora sp. KBS50]
MPWPLRVSALYSVCLVALVAAGYLLGRILTALATLSVAVAAAFLLAALLHPVNRLLRRIRLPRSLAALGGVVVLVLGLAGTAWLVTEQVASQFADLGSTLSSGLRDVRGAISTGPIPINERQLDALVRAGRRYLEKTDIDPAATASSTIEGLGGALLAVVLLFFLLRDGDRIWHRFLRLFPERHRDTLVEAGEVGWSTVSRYILGQVSVAAVDAVGIGIALLVIDVPLVAPLALLTFLGGFIPIVGATVAGAAAVLVALVANGPTDALLVLVSVIAVQQLEGNLLEPVIVGRALRLHPALVLLAVAAGTLTAGIIGAIVAVPTLAVLYRSGAVLLHRGPAGPAGPR